MKERKIQEPLIEKELTFDEFTKLIKEIVPDGYKVWRISQISKTGIFATQSDFSIIFSKK